MKRLIFVVDDEPDILNLVSLHLKKSGFEVEEFVSGSDFLKRVEEKIPDLVVLDLMLPDMGGIEICKILKNSEKFSGIGVLMLTALASETDVVLGLELGADDYMTKPFSPRELVARVKAILRRREKPADAVKLKLGDLEIDLEGYRVFVKGEEVSLTSTEFNILKILAKNPGRVFSREQILELLWGREKYVVERTVDVHIRHLREKLKQAASLIKNVRGVGYKIEK